MDNTIDLTLWKMLLLYALLAVPLAIIFWLRLGIFKDTIISVLRMSVQLGLVGLYLKYIFDYNSWALNILWMLAMLLTANFSALKQSGLSKKIFFCSLIGMATASISTTIFFVIAVIRPEPVYDARYLIPIFGMVLGNCMRSNVLSLERFYSGIRDNEKEFITLQMLGASLLEASLPYMRRSLKAAVAPQIGTMATIGIVSLPGMMTGQILGGAFPMDAIKYQIAIMICIFTAMLAGSTFNLFLSMRTAFNGYGMLKQQIFSAPYAPECPPQSCKDGSSCCKEW